MINLGKNPTGDPDIDDIIPDPDAARWNITTSTSYAVQTVMLFLLLFQRPLQKISNRT